MFQKPALRWVQDRLLRRCVSSARDNACTCATQSTFVGEECRSEPSPGLHPSATELFRSRSLGTSGHLLVHRPSPASRAPLIYLGLSGPGSHTRKPLSIVSEESTSGVNPRFLSRKHQKILPWSFVIYTAGNKIVAGIYVDGHGASSPSWRSAGCRILPAASHGGSRGRPGARPSSAYLSAASAETLRCMLFLFL